MRAVFFLMGLIFLVHQSIAAEAPALTLKKAEREKQTAFNEGWRWAYRKKIIMGQLRKDIDDSAIINRVFAGELGLTGTDKDILVKEAGGLVESLMSKGEVKKAGALKDIIPLFENENEVKDIEKLLNQDGGLERLARFLIGSYYEKRGFYPEAAGYYSMAAAGKGTGLTASAALHMRARLLFFEGKNDKAKELFQNAADSGFADSAPWLAGISLIKGEFDRAWQIYRGLKDRPAATIDPVTRMGMGDMDAVRKNFEGAREIFDGLRSRYSKNENLNVFFALKTADVWLLEGKRDEALNIYSRLKEKIRSGEGGAMATLSLADAFAAADDPGSWTKAERLYQEIAEGQYLGAENAHLSLIPVLMKTGRHEAALSWIEKFPARFPVSPLRADLQPLKGQAVSRWIDRLYNENDAYGVVKVFAKYSQSIPFGKRAEAYLKAGKSYAAVGLLPDAVNSLDNAVKLGRDSHAEEAMITLVKVYLSQGDAVSSERLMNIFRARYPRSAYLSEADSILVKTAFMKGDYRRAAQPASSADGPSVLMLKAFSFSKLNMHREAGALYSSAAKGFSEKGDERGMYYAYAGMADSEFMMEKYESAAAGYKNAIESIREVKGQDRSWALYRLAQSYSRLKKAPEKQEAVKELKGYNDEIGVWAASIFKEPGGKM